MSRRPKKPQGEPWGRRLVSWVDGEREPEDRTLFVMEKSAHRRLLQPPSEEEFERQEQRRLRQFFNWYPAAAVLICLALTGILLLTVTEIPSFCSADNPNNN